MSGGITAVLLLGALLVGLWLLSRAGELFVISVRGGRALVVRGRVPPAVLSGIADVVARARVERATIRAVAGEHHARLVTSGVDESTAQRLRNVFGQHPLQKLRGPTVKVPRNLGQILGIAWLAWWLTDRR